jgi:FlaA1/EpsC-like NDP-sugar epimerase
MPSFDEKLLMWLLERSPKFKVILMALFDFVALVFVVVLAYMLRFSSLELPPLSKAPLYLLAPVFSIASAFYFSIYNSAARGYSEVVEQQIVKSQLIACVIWASALLAIGTAGFARSIIVIYMICAIVSMILLRRLIQYIFLHRLGVRQKDGAPVLIFGAGNEGLSLANSLRRDGQYRPVGFIDNDPTLVDRIFDGKRVYSERNLAFAMGRWSVAEVIIAKPFETRSARRKLIESLIHQGLKVRIVPMLQDGVNEIGAASVRDINVEDLLGREPVAPINTLMKEALFSKTVVVTGAGGSIGSELSRQAFANQAATLILVDNNEFALFEIHRELEALQQSNTFTKILAVLADVNNSEAMYEVLSGNKVDIVFHAAAYKHVRMVQENVGAGLRNNVMGTKSLAEAALKAKVHRFVFVSTDKAVRPTGVMGASKRIAELYLQAMAAEVVRKRQSTIFSMVRFGNVLGSAGSVVPLFQEQIRKGGPIHVTHPEVTRYFMLIPEAAQLVIQAGAMAKGGEVFVLDMGDPIKIFDLAKAMVELAGLQVKTPEAPDGDVEIKFVGLRDGEKLYEELQIGHDVAVTEHGRILRSSEIWVAQSELNREWNIIEKALNLRQPKKAADLALALANRGAAISEHVNGKRL